MLAVSDKENAETTIRQKTKKKILRCSATGKNHISVVKNIMPPGSRYKKLF